MSSTPFTPAVGKSGEATREQLIEYIKKAKLKIKTLQSTSAAFETQLSEKNKEIFALKTRKSEEHQSEIEKLQSQLGDARVEREKIRKFSSTS